MKQREGFRRRDAANNGEWIYSTVKHALLPGWEQEYAPYPLPEEFEVTHTDSRAREFAVNNGVERKRVLLPRSVKGLELQEFLRKELGLPEKVKWFQVRFAVDEPVTVTCEYMPVVTDDH